MRSHLLRRLAANRDGSVMLETALMITILLVLMFGIIDLGRALFTENNLVSAAREGARYGAVDPQMPSNLDSVKAVTIRHFSPFGGPALTAANITAVANTTNGQITSVQVRIAYPFRWITPIARLVGTTFSDSLHSQAEYHWESQ